MGPRPRAAPLLEGHDLNAHRGGIGFPLASDGRWQRIKDLTWALMVRRAGQLEGATFGDEADHRLTGALAALRPDEETRELLLGALYDLATDLGRHIYSKPILEDDLADGVATLDRSFAASGLGHLRDEGVFFRTANVTFEPGRDLEGCDEAVRQAYVAGLLVGALGEAYNCRVGLQARGEGRFEIALGEGRDVNQEVAGHA